SFTRLSMHLRGFSFLFVGTPARQRCISSNQSCTTLVSDIRPSPLNEHNYSVSKADQEENVNKQPRQPGEVTGNVQLSDFRDGRGTADGCEAPLIKIMEIFSRIILQVAGDCLPYITALLHRHWRNSRQRPAVLIF